MPRRSHEKLKGRAKEEMLVTSRLMAISLLVDDYIYKNKPISLFEAKKLNEEITSLKLKCEKNTRSLQVVEKLKIFMKSIIKEQSMVRLQDNSPSFVTETCVENNPLIDVENNITNILTTNTTTELFTNSESQNSEINNITQDINKQISIYIINPEIRVRNSEIKPVEFNDIITSNSSSLKLNDKIEESIRYTSKNIDLDKDLNNPTNEKEQARQNPVMCISSNLQKQPEQEKECLIQENIKPNEITTGKKNKTKSIKKPDKNKTTTNNNNKTKTKKAKSNSNKELEKQLSEINKSNKKPKEKTQMNLSWVENIKYVREVSPDEHTNLQVEDSFWSNLTLPGAWNLNDFD